METLVSADVGGTFTDVIAITKTGIEVRKILSTPADYSIGVLDGVRACLGANGSRGELGRVVHATTVATNALLEGRGAKVSLITTKGFRDVLEFGRMRRPSLYDLSWQKPKPLVRRALRREADERIDATGKVLKALDDSEASLVIRSLMAEGVDAIAICLLNSYVNPSHERRLAQLAVSLAPHLFVTASCEILPRIKEFERTSTTVVNAYVGPLLKSYVGSLQAGLDEISPDVPLLLMQSNGGLLPARSAAARAAALVESGPAAGALGVGVLARQLGVDMIGLDIGGTTAKGSLIEGGQAREVQELEVGVEINVQSRLLRGGGYVISLPAIDLAEVGAGGGSIAWVDAGGALKVGPHSAGASPGPACYGLGGDKPTVTDAFAALGFLGEGGIAGGERRIDVDSACRTIQDQIGSRLGLAVEDAAWGVFLVATATMGRAVRAVTTERGRDPRSLTMAAFGGAGPVHAAELARQMGLPRVIVPPLPGVFSSLGLLLADMRFDYVLPVMRRSNALTTGDLKKFYSELEAHASREVAKEGIDPSGCRREWVAELRYDGQSSELTIAASPSQNVQDLVEAFGAEHERAYGHSSKDEVVVFTSLHLKLRSPSSKLSYEDVAAMAAARASGGEKGERRVYFGRERGWLTTPVVHRADLAPGASGPLVVAEYDTNVVVPPGFSARLDEFQDIILIPI